MSEKNIKNINIETELEAAKKEIAELKEKLKTIRLNNNSFLNTALCRAQSEFGILPKDANSFGNQKYTSFSKLIEATIPTLNKNGLSVKFHMKEFQDGTIIIGKLCHNSGQEDTSSMKLLYSDKNDKVNINQARGAAISYAKRQILEALLGMATE